MDKSKGAVDMGDWNGDKAKNDLLKEKNFKTLAKSVCLLLEDGWEEKKKGALKYPVMNLKGGKWIYNAEGLSSARAYGEQHDTSVADKAITLQKKLGLYKDDKDKEDKMSDIKEKEDVVMAQEEETKVDDKEKEVEKKEMSAKEEKEMGCDKAMSDEKESKDEVKEGKEEDSKEEEEEKSMSEQAKEFA